MNIITENIRNCDFITLQSLTMMMSSSMMLSSDHSEQHNRNSYNKHFMHFTLWFQLQQNRQNNMSSAKLVLHLQIPQNPQGKIWTRRDLKNKLSTAKKFSFDRWLFGVHNSAKEWTRFYRSSSYDRLSHNENIIRRQGRCGQWPDLCLAEFCWRPWCLMFEDDGCQHGEWSKNDASHWNIIMEKWGIDDMMAQSITSTQNKE